MRSRDVRIAGLSVRHSQACKPSIVRRSCNKRWCKCTKCNQRAGRDRVLTRKYHDLGKSRPRMIVLTYSQHYCPHCDRYFAPRDMPELGGLRARFTNRVVKKAIAYSRHGQVPLEAIAFKLWRHHSVEVNPTTIKRWLDAAKLESRK